MHPMADTYLFEGNGDNKETLCLMIHGFTGSPAHLRELSEKLNAKGFTVQSLRLPGHGTSPENMETTTSKDWLTHVREALKIALKDYKKVNLVGISMGGLMSMILASENSRINKIVTMSAPIIFRNNLIKLTPILKYFKRFNEIVPPEVVEGENDDLDIGYRKTPLKCAPHLIKISKMARKNLSKIKNPILIIHSLIDGQVMPESGDIIYDKVSSTEKEKMILDNSKHIITLGLQRKEVENRIIEFLTK